MSDPATSILVLAAVVGLTIVCMLHALSSTLLREVGLIDLKRETARLRAEHAKRLAELRKGRVESAEVGVPAESRKAA